MEAQKIKDSNCTLGAPVNWDTHSNVKCEPLPVRIGILPDNAPVVESAWKPTETELAALNAGGAVILRIYGNGMPPVQLYVESGS